MYRVGKHVGYRLTLMAALFTALLVLMYEWLPERHLQIWPNPELGRELLFADAERGGKSTVSWTDTPGQFRCVMRPSEAWKICGMHIPLGDGREQGIDLTPYTHIELDVEYQGPTGKIRFYIRNFEPGFSQPNDYESNKFNNVIVSVDQYQPPWRAPLALFTVADWWKHDNNVPLEYTMPGFEQAIMFGIDLAYPSELGAHTFTVNRIEFTGPLLSRANWYQLLLGLWVVALVAIALRQYWGLKRRVARDEERLESLQSYSQSLHDKSEKYKQLSMRDQLTGVLNRHGIAPELDRLYPSGESFAKLALMLIDLDHFKQLNDNLGHQQGDETLKALCTLILHNIRTQDIFCRWGGEEFMLICPQTEEQDAQALAEKLRQLISQTEFDGVSDGLTISIGITCARARESFTETFQRADAALYQAKHSGRNTCVFK